jgi:sulfur relay (sulfurtransferase) complex TusBCD TusD component (DsrE family)
MRMIKLVLASLAVVFSLAVMPATAGSKHPGGPIYVVHLTKFNDGLQSAFMATMRADQLQRAGANVTLYLDVLGVNAADLNQPNELHFGLSTKTYAELYNQFIADGGDVVVCPGCAASSGVTNLRPGAHFADETTGEVAKLLLKAKGVLDY